MIRIKRAYEDAVDSDGFRVLVDRLWPRGVKKEDARIDLWMKEIAPSTELREWFGHDPERWDEFRRRYRAELADHKDDLKVLRDKAGEGSLTLIFAAKDVDRNNAVVLKEALESM